MHTEHINPHGGDVLDNLCLSCSSCNLSKGQATKAEDPQTGQETPLFNPRTQKWRGHFVWIDGGLRLQGITAVGRATIFRLKINQDRLVRARKNWIIAGNHPPQFFPS
jgi:hypothetical protein